MDLIEMHLAAAQRLRREDPHGARVGAEIERRMRILTTSLGLLRGTTWACSSSDSGSSSVTRPASSTTTPAGSALAEDALASDHTPAEAPALAAGRPAPPECRVYDELLEASHQRLADYASEEPHRAWAREKADAMRSPETAEALANTAAVAVRDALIRADYAAAARFVGPDGVCVQDRIGGPCTQLTAAELSACGTSVTLQRYVVDLVSNTTEELTCDAAMKRVLFPAPALATATPAFNCFPDREDADPMSVITADRGVEDIYVELHAPAVGATPWRSVWLVFSVASGQPRLTAIAPHARLRPPAPPGPAAGGPWVPDAAVSAAAYLYNDGADVTSPSFCRSLFQGTTRCASAGPPKLVSARQLASLRALLATPRAWSKAASRCVPRPHHGFELFDDQGTRIDVLDVCFECATIASGATKPSRASRRASERSRTPRGAVRACSSATAPWAGHRHERCDRAPARRADRHRLRRAVTGARW